MTYSLGASPHPIATRSDMPPTPRRARLGRCIATETVIREDVIAIPKGVCQQRAAGPAGPPRLPDGGAVRDRDGAALRGDVAASAIPTHEQAFVTRFLEPPAVYLERVPTSSPRCSQGS